MIKNGDFLNNVIDLQKRDFVGELQRPSLPMSPSVSSYSIKGIGFEPSNVKTSTNIFQLCVTESAAYQVVSATPTKETTKEAVD